MRIRVLLVALGAAVALCASAQSKGEKSVGVQAGYNTRSEGATAGLWFEYSFSEHLRLSPSVEYIFRHNGNDALAINCDVQFPFALDAGRRVSVYPLVGLNYTSWEDKHLLRIDDGDVSSRLNRVGLNAGAGIDFKVTHTLKLAIEAKAAIASGHSYGGVTLGIGYCF